MSLALFDRIGRLLRADAHGVVDALEERGLLLRQHLREAELALLDKRARLEEQRRELGSLACAETRLEQEESHRDADVERALDADDEQSVELARFAARRWIAVRRERERIAHRTARLESDAARLEEEIERQAGELAELEAHARAFEARPVSAERAPQGGVADEDVELELLRRRDARGTQE